MDESLLKLLTITLAVGGSWATVRVTLASHAKTIAKLEEALEAQGRRFDEALDAQERRFQETMVGHERRLTVQETTTTLSNGNLQQAIGRVEGQVSALHKRLDNYLGARPPREEGT